MSQEEMSSIVEFSEDITTQEAPPPLPVGEYEAEIRKAEAAISNNSGNKFAKVAFYVAPEDYPPDFDASTNPEGVTMNYSFVSLEDTPKGRYQCRKFCEKIGATTAKSIDLNEWIGLRAIVEVVHGEYNGEPQAQIKSVREV